MFSIQKLISRIFPSVVVTMIVISFIYTRLAVKKGKPDTSNNTDKLVSKYHDTTNSDAADQWHVLVTVSQGFQDMFENWFLYFCSLHLPFRLIVLAEDNNTYFKYHKLQNIIVMKAFDPVMVTNSMSYESKNYKKLVSKRPSHIIRVFRPGMKLIYTDIDTVWLKDPTPYFIGSRDMWASLDKVDLICTGFMAMRCTPGIFNFLRVWENAMKRPALNQPVFNQLIRKSNVSLKSLSRERFPSGDIYFDCMDTKRRENVVVVHNNWIIGHEKKVNRFINAGLWVYNASVQMESIWKLKCNNLH